MASQTHKVQGVGAYIAALAKYNRRLPSQPGASGSELRPSGVSIRSKEPNVPSPKVARPSGRPPAEHIVRILAKSVVSGGVNYKPAPTKVAKTQIIHPGKALALKSVKAIHLGHPTVKKVSA